MLPEIVRAVQSKLSTRMDPAYWHPRWNPPYAVLECWKERLAELGDFIGPGCITYGQVGSRHYDPSGEVLYLQAKNIPRSCTGIDPHARHAMVAAGSRNDPSRSRIARGDLLLVRSGVASIGRAVALTADPGPANISQHICRIRLHGLGPAYAAVFLISAYGSMQIRRLLSGVGTHEIDFDEIRSLRIPVLDEPTVARISEGYSSMAAAHASAMDQRQAPDSAGSMLSALVSEVEQLTERGPR
jgi:hypothetical protein